jgi:hypothetical protein
VTSLRLGVGRPLPDVPDVPVFFSLMGIFLLQEALLSKP